jgi:hypothetical protein
VHEKLRIQKETAFDLQVGLLIPFDEELKGEHVAGMWAVCMREGVNHRSHDTTSIAEGWHSSVKGWVRSQGTENLRVDRLIYFLLTWVGGLYEYKDIRRQHGARLIAESMA